VCPIDITSTLSKCEEMLVENKTLSRQLLHPDFVSTKMNTVQGLEDVLGRKLSLGMVLDALYGDLVRDKTIKKILEKDTTVKNDADFYSFFMFFCAVLIYTEHIVLARKSITEGEQ